MHETVKKLAQTFAKQREQRRRACAAFTALAILVSISTTYLLVQPANTLAVDYVCGMEAHVHTEECYELICGYGEEEKADEESALSAPSEDTAEEEAPVTEETPAEDARTEETVEGDAADVTETEQEPVVEEHPVEEQEDAPVTEEETAEEDTTSEEERPSETESVVESAPVEAEQAESSETQTPSAAEEPPAEQSAPVISESVEESAPASDMFAGTISASLVVYSNGAEEATSVETASEPAASVAADVTNESTEVSEPVSDPVEEPTETETAENGEQSAAETPTEETVEHETPVEEDSSNEEPAVEESASTEETAQDEVTSEEIPAEETSPAEDEQEPVVEESADEQEAHSHDHEAEHVHSAACYRLICEKEEHVHSEDDCMSLMNLLEDLGELPEGYTNEYGVLGDGYTVAVFAPDGALPEGAELVATLLEEGDDAHTTAQGTLEAMVAQEVEVNVGGMMSEAALEEAAANSASEEAEKSTEEVAEESVAEPLVDEVIAEETESSEVTEPIEEAATEELETEESSEPAELVEEPVVEETLTASLVHKDNAHDEETAEEPIPYEEEFAYDGFVAFDVHFEQNGKEIEPTKPVFVYMDIKGLLPENADPESVRILHLKETIKEPTLLETLIPILAPEPVVESVEVVADNTEATGVVEIELCDTAEELKLTSFFALESFSTIAATFTSSDGLHLIPDGVIANAMNATVKLFNYTQAVNTDLERINYACYYGLPNYNGGLASGTYAQGVFAFENGYNSVDNTGDYTYSKIEAGSHLTQNYGNGWIGAANLMFTPGKKLVDGYPILTGDVGDAYKADPDDLYAQGYWVELGNDSMKYLFDEGTGSYHKATMSNGGGLFLENADGSYEFDSSYVSAFYNSSTNQFDLYDAPNYPLYFHNYNTSDGIADSRQFGNFLPFNSIGDVGTTYKKVITNEESKTDVTHYALTSNPDMWFGMTIDFDFYMPKDGEINNDDMVFEFDGDDDVMVFIDDVLVLDITGIHGPENASINFATGEVKDLSTKYLNGGASTTLKQRFIDAGESTDGFDGNSFKDYTPHKLKFFYMERGGNISHCHIKVNMPTLPENALMVTKNVVDESNTLSTDQTFDFRVMVGGTTPLKSASYDIWENGVDTGKNGTTNNSTGIFSLKAGQSAVFPNVWSKTSSNNYQYTVEEVFASDSAVLGSLSKIEYVVGANDSVGDGSYTPTTSKTSYSTGTISAEESQVVAFTNTARKTGELTIQKDAFVNGIKNGETFSFELSSSALAGKTYGDVQFNSSGVANVSVTSGSSKTISGLPAGAEITVKEILPNGSDYETNYTVDNGAESSGTAVKVTITQGGTKTVYFKNAAERNGSLTIYKNAYLNGELTEGTFNFKLTSDALKGKTYGGVAFNTSGVATVSVVSGSSKTITGLPEGAVIVVTETNSGDYTAEWSFDGQNYTEGVNADAVTVEKNGAATVYFKNSLERTGKLIINKEAYINGEENDGETFNFELTAQGLKNKTYDDVSFDGNGVATVSVTSGNFKEINGLPAGVQITVKEILPDGSDYEASYTIDSGNEPVISNTATITVPTTVDNTGSIAVNFKNKATRVGTLVVSKIATINGVQNEDSFNFQLTSSALAGKTFDDVEFDDSGVANISVTSGSSKTISGLPMGVEIVVKEILDSDSGYTVEWSTDGEPFTEGITAAAVTIENGETTTVAFQNTIVTGDLVIYKDVYISGTENNESGASFSFELTSEALAGETFSGVEFDENGKATIRVTAGAFKTISGLPVGAEIKIVETDFEGYAPSVSRMEESGSFENSSEITVTIKPIVGSDGVDYGPTNVYYRNATGAVLPNTGGMGTHIYTTLGIVMMLGAGVLLLDQRRRREGPSAT